MQQTFFIYTHMLLNTFYSLQCTSIFGCICKWNSHTVEPCYRWTQTVFLSSRWMGFFSTTKRPTTPLAARRWSAGSDPIWWQISWASRCHSVPSPASLIMPAISFSRSWSTRKPQQKFVRLTKTADMNWNTCPRQRHSWRTLTALRKRAWMSEDFCLNCFRELFSQVCRWLRRWSDFRRTLMSISF